jgi:hypothetical protein
MTSLSQSLASLRNELDATTARLHALTDTLDDNVWRARPASHRWSAGECVEHLNMTSRAFLPSLRDALKDARARGLTNPGGANRVNLLGRWVLHVQEPPVKRQRRVKTSKRFEPIQVGPKGDVINEYEKLQRELIYLLVDADGLALTKVKIPSPFLPRLRYSVYFALRMIPGHQRRHLWQAEEAVKAVRAAGR